MPGPSRSILFIVAAVAAMAVGIGSIVAALLLTRTLAAFTGLDALAQLPGASFVVALVFGLAALTVLATTPKA